MPEPIALELKPTTFLTIGTVGPPGRRIFFLQGSRSSAVISLMMEKEQADALGKVLTQLIDQLSETAETETGGQPVSMELLQPVAPLFRIGQMGLGYDEMNDLIVIHAQELLPETAEGTPGYVRFWVSPAQARALCARAKEVVVAGRPVCALCGQPVAPEGHFCPPGNGHEKPWPHD